MAVYEPKTRFQPWTYDELARVPRAQVQADLAAYDSATSKIGLGTETYSDWDKQVVGEIIAPIDTEAQALRDRIAAGESISDTEVRQLMDLNKQYQQASSYINKYNQAVQSTFESIKNNPYAKDWEPEKIQALAQGLIEPGFIDKQGNIQGRSLYVPKRWDWEKDMQKYMKQAGTRSIGKSSDGQLIYSREQILNNPQSFPEAARTLALMGENPFIQIDSKQKVTKASNEEGLAHMRNFVEQGVATAPWKQASLSFEFGDNWTEVLPQMMDSYQKGLLNLKDDQHFSRTSKGIGDMENFAIPGVGGAGLISYINVEENDRGVRNVERRFKDTTKQIEVYMNRGTAQRAISETESGSIINKKSSFTRKEFQEILPQLKSELEASGHSPEQVDSIINEVFKIDVGEGAIGMYGLVSGDATMIKTRTDTTEPEIDSFYINKVEDMFESWGKEGSGRLRQYQELQVLKARNPEAYRAEVLQFANQLQYDDEKATSVIVGKQYAIPEGPKTDDVKKNLATYSWKDARGTELKLDDRRELLTGASGSQFRLDLQNNRLLLHSPSRDIDDAYIDIKGLGEGVVKNDLKSFSTIANNIIKPGRFESKDPAILNVLNNNIYRGMFIEISGGDIDLSHKGRIEKIEKVGDEIRFYSSGGKDVTTFIGLDVVSVFYNILNVAAAHTLFEGKSIRSER